MRGDKENARPSRRSFVTSVAAGTAAALAARPAWATWPFVPSGAFNSDLNVNTEWFNIVSFGAIGDGASHPASGVYGSLAALQTAYPFATALTNEINALAVQAAINAASNAGGGIVYCPYGTYVMDNSNSPLDGSATLYVMDYSFQAANQVSILGNGDGTTLYWPVDLGQPATASFTGSISTTTLTAGTPSNPIVPGMWLKGAGLTASTKVLRQLTGTPNGAGTYLVNMSQTVASEAMNASFSSTCNPYGRAGAIVFGNYSDTENGAKGFIQDINFLGPGVGSTVGASTSQMMGILTADSRSLMRVTSQGFWAGINVQGAQTSWFESYFNFNYYGAYFQAQTNQFGDMEFINCHFNQNNFAGIAVTPVYAIETSVFTKCTFDAQPFGIYKEPWTLALKAAVGFGPDSFTQGAILYDTKLLQCQFENCGNSAIGDGLNVSANFTGSISGTTLTTTGSPNLQVGQQLIQVSGGPAIAAGTFIMAIGGANSFTVSVSQTVASGTIGAQSSSSIYNSNIEHSQMGWWQSGGGGSGLVIAGLSAAGLITCGAASGLFIVEPTSTFQWTPGSDAIFSIQRIATAIGTVDPQPGFSISGDISTLIDNCNTGVLGGHGFFSNAAFITPGSAIVRNQNFWTAEPTGTFGYGSTAIDSVVNRPNATTTPGTVTLCAGTAQDDVHGILVFPAQWGLVATGGLVPVASGANSISAGQWVRTAAGGIVTGATGKTDTTSVVIGYAYSASSGGFTVVKLLGLV